MKTIDQYNNIKKQYQNYVVLLKVGSFYITYHDDAYILNHLFSYQIKDKKVGFPIGIIEKIKSELKTKQINLCLMEDDLILIKYPNNEYQKYLYNAKMSYFNEQDINNLLEQITFLIKSDFNNFKKIKEFINEF